VKNEHQSVTSRVIEARSVVVQKHNVRFEFNELTVDQGEILTVIGASGCGKTTLLRTIAGIEPARSGSVRVEGRCAYVAQHPLILERSVWQNAVFGLKGLKRDSQVALERTKELLQSVGLGNRLKQVATSLSSGEQVRLCVVRALAIDPNVLLLDEPTANLDPSNVLLVEKLVTDFVAAGGAAVMVTHNLFQATRLGDRSAFLQDGRVVEIFETSEHFNAAKHPSTRAFIEGRSIW
jgi:tungstate transport system ATP-binding protein